MNSESEEIIKVKRESNDDQRSPGDANQRRQTLKVGQGSTSQNHKKAMLYGKTTNFLKKKVQPPPQKYNPHSLGQE